MTLERFQVVPGKVRQSILVSVLSLGGVSCGFLAGNLPSMTSPEEGIADIKLPPGFSIEVYVSDIDGARSMTLSPGGIPYVGTIGTGKVYAVDTRPETAPEPIMIADELDSPNGVAFRDGSLYVAGNSRVIRFDGIEASLRNAPEYIVAKDGFPID